MKSTEFRKRKLSLIALALLMISVSFQSCTEEIDQENRYTFTGHTIGSFLEENDNVYHDFIYILNRSHRMNLMKAYGQYTCFAPTNEAIERYLIEADSIWQHTKNDSVPTWTGVTSPHLEDLSDSMCIVLAQTHLIEKKYLTTEMDGDIIPSMNMNDRYLTIGNGVRDHKSTMLINDAEIIVKDEEVENGVIHTLNKVLSPASNTLPTEIAKYDYFSIFNAALIRTGFDMQMQDYKDPNYTDGRRTTADFWKTGISPYPKHRYYGYSAFIEPDEVYNKAGIYSVAELYEKCKEWYPEATDPDFKSENNALNQFVAYHLTDTKVRYERLVCYKLSNSNFKSEKNLSANYDRTTYYESLNHKLLKVTMPRSKKDASIYINYAKKGAMNPSMKDHTSILIHNPKELDLKDFNQVALNGIIHVINKILIYNENEMAGNILMCTMRFDFATLSPELVTNDLRWTQYGAAGYCNGAEYFIPNGYCKNFRYHTEDTRNYLLCPEQSWTDYEGDELCATGNLDMEYKLPPLPTGTYEIRLGYSANSYRHTIQFYIDDKITGLPIDLRIPASDPLIGWVKDSETNDNGVSNDKQMRNRGYMKAPACFQSGAYGNARQFSGAIRKVLATMYIVEGKEHWLRMKSVNTNDDGTAQFTHDYLEIVPIEYVRNEDVPLSEKRE